MAAMGAIAQTAELASTPVVEMPWASWQPKLSAGEQVAATRVVESGGVLYFPRLPFVLEPAELQYLSPAWCGPGSKNISLDQNSGAVRGAQGQPEQLAQLGAMIARFARCARALADALFPAYRSAFTLARSS